MNTLADAWQWYESARAQLRRMKRIAEKHWDELPWEGQFGRDDDFRLLGSETVIQDAKFSSEPLQDLAILVLFSVFERQVRQHVYKEVAAEASSLKHRSLKQAGEDILHQIEEGSFFRVLEPFKKAHPDLVEQVNQIRQYRNWVAHGRSDEDRDPLDPKTARERLQRFLDLLGLSAVTP